MSSVAGAAAVEVVVASSAVFGGGAFPHAVAVERMASLMSVRVIAVMWRMEELIERAVKSAGRDPCAQHCVAYI
jgi:hypothetical protein